MKRFKKDQVRCSNCNRVIIAGNTNGMPNGVGFVLDTGKRIDICQSCLIEVGKMTDASRERFFKRLEQEHDSTKS